MDQVERANFEHLAVTGHLPQNLSDLRQRRQLYVISHILICAFRLLFAVWFLMQSQIRK